MELKPQEISFDQPGSVIASAFILNDHLDRYHEAFKRYEKDPSEKAITKAKELGAVYVRVKNEVGKALLSSGKKETIKLGIQLLEGAKRTQAELNAMC